MARASGFETVLDEVYRTYAGLAARYYYTFRRPRVTSGGKPVFLLLGNHSSGKSSLINRVLGGEGVQDVGVAPTDDGFTFLVYGETESDTVGAAALALLPAEFRDLERFGGRFLQHLRVKVRNRPRLREFVLVDSPGMIDGADAARDRDYDFTGVVRRFAEVCDLVLFLFDPDKPGTTGETVRVFSSSLSDVQYKLRVVLNKCDLFSNAHDFARAYGTLCWNLSRVLRTKDLPKILTVGNGAPAADADAWRTDLCRHGDELFELFTDSAARRSDNLYAQALDDSQGLSVRMAVVNAALRSLALGRFAYALGSLAFAATASVTVWLLAAMRGPATVAWLVCGLTAAAVLGLAAAAYPFVRSLMRLRLSRKVDAFFAWAFRESLAAPTHDGLANAWSAQRDATAELVRAAPLKVPFLAEFRRRRFVRAMARALDAVRPR